MTEARSKRRVLPLIFIVIVIYIFIYLFYLFYLFYFVTFFEVPQAPGFAIRSLVTLVF